MIKEKKHIYCNISDPSLSEFIKKDERFTPVHKYEGLALENAHENEWGIIETENNYFHIILGTVRQEKCPWCSGKVKVIKLPKKEACFFGPPQYDRYCLQCENCGSQGPILFNYPDIKTDQTYIDEIFDMLKQRYSVRRPWDDGLVN